MTTEQIASVGGVFLSLLFSYFPGLKKWYSAKPGNVKRYIMLGVFVVVIVAVFGLNCAGLIDVGWACGWPGAWDAVLVLVAAVVSNQAAYLLTPK